jgi:hypothetical protein
MLHTHFYCPPTETLLCPITTRSYLVMTTNKIPAYLHFLNTLIWHSLRVLTFTFQRLMLIDSWELYTEKTFMLVFWHFVKATYHWLQTPSYFKNFLRKQCCESNFSYVKCEISTAVGIQVVVLPVLVTWRAVGEYQRFGGTCCLHLQDVRQFKSVFNLLCHFVCVWNLASHVQRRTQIEGFWEQGA